MRLIDADAMIKEITEVRCVNCDRRKGMKKGKMTFVYEIGDVPCRACDVMDTIDVLDEAPTVGGWISVKDRLPDTKLKREKWVLVSLVNNNNGHRWETPVVAEYVTRDKEWFFAGCDIDDVTVTHWTHLPEPPKEVTEHDQDDF